LNYATTFGGACAFLVGGALIFGLVNGFAAGFWGLVGVSIALYCFLKQLNGMAARDIEHKHRKKGEHRGNR